MCRCIIQIDKNLWYKHSEIHIKTSCILCAIYYSSKQNLVSWDLAHQIIYIYIYILAQQHQNCVHILWHFYEAVQKSYIFRFSMSWQLFRETGHWSHYFWFPQEIMDFVNGPIPGRISLSGQLKFLGVYLATFLWKSTMSSIHVNISCKSIRNNEGIWK